MSAQKYFATIGTTGHSRFSDISNLFLKYHQESRSMGNICKGKQFFFALWNSLLHKFYLVILCDSFLGDQNLSLNLECTVFCLPQKCC